ncbi:MAG: hypothetical protein FJZ92_08675 [Chloroflexi bacterium]|nr:hypothetical protein [Chloroflexota bacterium]
MFLQSNALTHVDAIDGWRDEFVAYLKTAFAEGKTWADVIAYRDELQPHRVMRGYYGFFETADGMVTIACNPRTLRLKMVRLMQLDDRWTTEPGWLPDDTDAHEEHVRAQVVAKFREHTTDHWVRLFRQHGLPIGPTRHVEKLFNDEQAWTNGFFARIDHPALGGVTMVAPPVRFSATPLEAKPSPRLGADSRATLRESGLSDGAIDALVARGVVRDGAA